MSREASYNSPTEEVAETLEVIREFFSPALSSLNVDTPEAPDKAQPQVCSCSECACLEHGEKMKTSGTPIEVDKLLKKREAELTAEFRHRLERDINILKERADFILQNEQVRASYMLREAHRERQEKISALQTQLECKNLAGLMYVMCSERRKSKLEILRIVQEYTDYIHALQEILSDAQAMILNLSRGYKTAARVDNEWRQKMEKVLTEFQTFVHDYVKGTPETEQFFFDIPALLKSKSPLVDNPNEDPCGDEELVLEEDEISITEKKKPWYEKMDEDCRPFVMFGDMAEFKPPQRREVLRALKEVKSAPTKWKEYVFNDMFVKSECSAADMIKDEYLSHVPAPARWECQAQHDQDINHSKTREKLKHSDHTKVVLNVGTRRASFFDENEQFELVEEEKPAPEPKPKASTDIEQDTEESASALGSIHNDSLSIIQNHIPEKDHTINYEKICPMDKCQRMKVDSFVRSLPPYMRANPFTYFEQTYEQYEVCSPEQLAVLKQRIEAKKKQEKIDLDKPELSPLLEWAESGTGVSVQTSDLSVNPMPPCSCRVPRTTPVNSAGCIYNLEGLIPVKQTLDNIKHECLHDSTIEFNRFKVIGQDSSNSVKKPEQKKNRLQEITSILKQHPSLLEIFQGNAA